MTTSERTETLHPRTVIDGLSLPSLLNNGTLSIFEKALFGLGSHAVPSTYYTDGQENKNDALY